MLNTTENLPKDFLEVYQDQLQKQLGDLSVYFLSLSDIDIEYCYTVIKISIYFPAFCKPFISGTLYKYFPDQRPITMRLIGKPSSGPSPPHSFYCYGLT